MGNRHDPTVLEESDDDRKNFFYGIYHQEAADFLEKVVRRHNVFVCGGTGSGGTTF